MSEITAENVTSEANLVESIHAQPSTSFASKYSIGRHRIYEVTKGIQSNQTKTVYQQIFKHFQDYVKIYDLQVLLDFSPKVIKQMVIDYILWLRDEKPGKKLSRTSIKVHLAAILHFFQINNDDFNLTIKNFRIHLPSDDSVVNDDRPILERRLTKFSETATPEAK